MLTSNSSSQKTGLICLALLLFISLSFNHSYVYAQELKELTAEEYHSKGFEAQEQGNLDNALFYYNKAISLGLEDASILNDMGILSEQMAFDVQAEQFYLKALKIDPKNLSTYSNLAYFYLKSGQKAKAAKYFRLRYELADPEDPWAQKAKEELFNIHPDHKNWVIALEAERADREMAVRAQKLLDEEIARVKKITEDHFSSGKAYFDKGEYYEAIKEYNRALELSPQHNDIRKAKERANLELIIVNVNKHWERAKQLLNEGENISAQIEIQKILTVIPDEPIIRSK
jgi:Flp pilus assembly protein TadD